MAPVAVLASLGQLGGSLPPTYLVGCQPASVEEGIGLSPAVAAAVEPAIGLVREVLTERLGLEGSPPTERSRAARTSESLKE
jgi:hydrogenase maturation protease